METRRHPAGRIRIHGDSNTTDAESDARSRRRGNMRPPATSTTLFGDKDGAGPAGGPSNPVVNQEHAGDDVPHRPGEDT